MPSERLVPIEGVLNTRLVVYHTRRGDLLHRVTDLHRPGDPRRTDPRRATGRSAQQLLITAGPGFGKSRLLEEMRPERGIVTMAADLVADGLITGGLPEGLTWIGVDAFEAIAAEAQTWLIRLLLEQPGLDLAISSRVPVSAEVRQASNGRFVQRDASDLALAPYAIARLLAEDFGPTDPATALRVADLTAGWPMLVHFASDALSRHGHVDLAAALTSAGAPAADWLRSAVVSQLSSPVLEVLRAVAGVDPAAPMTQPVWDTVAGVLGQRPESHTVDELRQAGILHAQRRLGAATELVIVPALAMLLRDDATRVPVWQTAQAMARTYEGAHRWLRAGRAHAVAGDPGAAHRVLDVHGEDILREGDAAAFVALVDQVVGESLVGASDTLRRTYGDGLRMVGDPSRARRAFAPLAARADREEWPAGLSTRVANLHYLCGQFASACEVLDRSIGHLDRLADSDIDEDLVDWWACRVHVLAMLGRSAEAATAATHCVDLAQRLGASRPLGVAHLALAKTCRGTLKDLHHDQALRYAIEAGDAVTAARTLAARACWLLGAARYDLACVSAREAARMARLCCPPGLQAAVEHNLGEALAHTGSLDEARWHLECSISLSRHLGPARAALGLVGLAAVHRLVGNREQSRSGYAEAVELARGSGDVQVLVQALCGQALLALDQQPAGSTSAADLELAQSGSTRDAAVDLAGEALRLAPDDLLPLALTTSGRVALSRGERRSAAELADSAVALAREVRAADLLADALELSAAATHDPGHSRRALAEARSIWSEGGALPAAARVEVLLGRLPDADGTERSRARDADRTLSRLGIRTPADRLSLPPESGTVSVAVLGPFAVTVDGTPVPFQAWRSKQARTLVKVLAASRGRVVTRERLCDVLWPDDDPARTGHRLSVLLATVRGVLDPSKGWPADRYIAAETGGLRLRLGAVVLDADLLLSDAAHASELLQLAESERAREVLRHVDQLYRGEAFEDEHEDWADGVREEVRGAWGRSMRRLANLELRAGRGPEALGIFARLLTVDPYDETIHRRLVTSLARAGRHGEARRAFDRWCQAMRDIDAPVPDPDEVGFNPTLELPVLTPR